MQSKGCDQSSFSLQEGTLGTSDTQDVLRRHGCIGQGWTPRVTTISSPEQALLLQKSAEADAGIPQESVNGRKPPISKMYNSILPPSTPPGARAEMSILAGIHHVPALAMLRWLSAISHALSQRWLPPLEVNDDSVYWVLLALGGLTSLNKCNEYI